MERISLSILFFLSVILILSGNARAIDDMRIRIRTQLPNEIKTVGRAAQYYAATIGYRLTTIPPAPYESGQIANEILDPLSKTAGIRPIEDAILSLLRDEYMLVVDRSHKLFSFQFKEAK